MSVIMTSENIVCGRKLYLMLCIIIPLVGTSQLQVSDSVDKIAHAFADVYGFSGSIVIGSNDSVLFQEAYGYADRAFQVLNSDSTRYSINSISKIFTAVAIMQLVEDGRVQLHSPVGRYLPNLHASWKDSVSIHHLLTHTSGLPRESGLQPWDQLELDDQLELVNAQSLLFIPGTRYGYSNSGVILLGAVLEKVSGQSYDVYIEKNLIRPLGLKDTGFYKGWNVVSNLAVPYRLSSNGLEETQRSKHFGDNPGGGMYSTPLDLYKFVRRIEEGEILSAASLNLMLEPHTRNGEGEYEGYGWSIKDFGDQVIYMAAGSGYGTKSVMIWSRDKASFICITSNWGNTPILNMLRDIYLTLQGQAVELPSTNALADPDEYADALGSYLFDRGQMTMHLGMDLDMLVLQEFEGKLFLEDELLVDKGNGLLFLTYTDELNISLAKGSMLISINGNEIKGIRAPE